MEKKFDKILNASGWQVETPSGFVDIVSLMRTTKMDEWELSTLNGLTLPAADNHIVIDEDGVETFMKNIDVGQRVRTRAGVDIVSRINPTGRMVPMYDMEISDSDHVYYANDILSHNTTTSMAYLLHQAITRKNITIAILANKGETAAEVLDRIKFAYESLPWFLQVGVKTWNKKSVEFGNGSKIITAATSSSSIRGKSVNCVVGETRGIFRNATEDGQFTIQQMFCSLPNHKRLENNVKYDWIADNNGWEVLTEKGWKSFKGIATGKYRGHMFLIQTGTRHVIVTPKHKFILPDGSVRWAKDLKVGDVLVTQDFDEDYTTSTAKVTAITKKFFRSINVYDVVGVDETKSWFTNGLLSHNCILIDEMAHIENDVEFYTSTYPVISSGKTTQVIITSTPKGLNLFYKLWSDALEGRNEFKTLGYDWSVVPGRDEEWKRQTIDNTSPVQFAQEYECSFLGSSNTLISGHKLQQLSFKSPIEELSDDNLCIYYRPEENHNYCATVDVCEGLGQDFAVISVFDVTSMPYKMVMKYKNNLIQPASLTKMVFEFGTYYNQAYVLVENNSIGKIVADSLYYDFEYENLFKTQSKAGETEVTFSGVIPGIRTTQKTKALGCSQLKSLIESDNLIIEDFDAVSELSTFSSKNKSYAAEKGKTDDVVMTLVIFAWFTSQPYFNDMFDVDVRKRLRDSFHQESNISFMFVDDGLGNAQDEW